MSFCFKNQDGCCNRNIHRIDGSLHWDNDVLSGFNFYKDLQRRAGKTNQNFYRWAYTAITRASKTLYALNPPFFNSYSAMAFLDAAVINSLNELTGEQVQTEEISLDDELLKQLSVFNCRRIMFLDFFSKTSFHLQKSILNNRLFLNNIDVILIKT